MPLQRAMWIWNTSQLVVDSSQMDMLLSSAQVICLTDVYLYVAPTWLESKSADFARFNARLYAAGIRVWALDGDVHYIDDLAAKEVFMQGLKDLCFFSKDVQPEERFYGMHADIEPQDTADHPGCFSNGVAQSRLSSEQRKRRCVLMDEWVNTLAQASQLLRSQHLHFGAAMPFWLHDYEGEPITVSRGTKEVCVMDLIMPLLDEYVVMSYNTDPTNAASRIKFQAKYASEHLVNGDLMPHVLGSVEVGTVGDGCVSYGDTVEPLHSFGGMAIHHWTAWNELPSTQ